MLSSEMPSIAAYRTSAASHFPRMISKSRTGDVTSSSMVPVRFSSANRRMVIIGIRNSPITLTFENSGRITNSFTSIGIACPIIELSMPRLTKKTTAT